MDAKFISNYLKYFSINSRGSSWLLLLLKGFGRLSLN